MIRHNKELIELTIKGDERDFKRAIRKDALYSIEEMPKEGVTGIRYRLVPEKVFGVAESYEAIAAVLLDGQGTTAAHCYDYRVTCVNDACVLRKPLGTDK